MFTFTRAVLALLVMVATSLSAFAQTPTVLPPGSAITVSWDAPAGGVADAPTGYRFETFRETETGVVVTTTDVPVTPTTKVTLPSTILPPDGAFLLAVRAFNASGVSARSNALLFVRPSVPGVPTALRLDVP
jgi:hypothetical protein